MNTLTLYFTNINESYPIVSKYTKKTKVTTTAY